MTEERPVEQEQPVRPEPPVEKPAERAAEAYVASGGGKQVVAWMTVAALVLAGVTYGIGRLQTHGQISQAEAAKKAVEKRLEQAQAESAAKAAVVRRLEARRLLDQAATALEERNFGIAEAALSTSAELLSRSRQGSPPELVALEQEIAKFRPVATEDVGAQRARVLAWIKRCDRALPSTAP